MQTTKFDVIHENDKYKKTIFSSFVQYEILLKISEILTNLMYFVHYFNTFKVVHAKLVAINKVTSALLVRYFW